MKTRTCYFLLIPLFLLTPNTWAYPSGQGTQANPYQIATPADLLQLAQTPADYTSYFILTADIDMAQEGPFQTALIAPDTSSNDAFQGPAFNGIFNGNGHVIRNLAFVCPAGNDYIGLFGYAGYYPNSAQITDLGIENISINGDSGHKSIGAIVGEMYNGDIEQCYSTGSITLGANCQNIGGLIGYSTSADVSNSYSKCAVSCGLNGDKIGGLIGGCWSVMFEHNYSAGSVSAGSGSTNIGGFLGVNDNFFTDRANFWDIDASGQSTGMIVTGLQSIQMFGKAPFLGAGWDFIDETDNGENDYWKSPTKSYPILSWQNYIIGMSELYRLAETWLTDSQDPKIVYPVDYWQDGSINVKDFAMLSKSWLTGQIHIQFDAITDGFETGDFSALNWNSLGSYPWLVTSADSYEGTYCASIQGVPPLQAAMLTLDVTCSPGKIGFNYKMNGTRYLYVYIDSSAVGILGQTDGWSYAEYDITEGSHTIIWMFYLTMGGFETDIARLDNLRIFSPD